MPPANILPLIFSLVIIVYYELSLSNIRRQEDVVILFILFVTIDKTIPYKIAIYKANIHLQCIIRLFRNQMI